MTHIDIFCKEGRESHNQCACEEPSYWPDCGYERDCDIWSYIEPATAVWLNDTAVGNAVSLNSVMSHHIFCLTYVHFHCERSFLHASIELGSISSSFCMKHSCWHYQESLQTEQALVETLVWRENTTGSAWAPSQPLCKFIACTDWFLLVENNQSSYPVAQIGMVISKDGWCVPKVIWAQRIVAHMDY